MSAIARFRRSIVLFSGAIVTTIFLLLPPNARGDEPPCEEPWLEHCLMDLENCLNCQGWCDFYFPGDDCVVQFEYCDEDPDECKGELFPYWEVCMCEEGDPT